MTHSSHGFSGQSRIIACPGSIRMQEGMPNSTNDQAEKGTAVHECAEASILWGVDCKDFIGHTFNDWKITQDMAEAGQVYVDYVRQIVTQRPTAEVLIEKRVCLSSIDAERLWGTSDVIVIDRDNRTLIIGDYKNGYGIVEVDGIQSIGVTGDHISGNAQMVGYALATLDTYDLWQQIDHVVTFVAQPNVDHKDGKVRYTSYTTQSLLAPDGWYEVYRLSHAESLKQDSIRVAGPHCKYCKARGFCGTRITSMIQQLQLDQSIHTCSVDQLIGILDEIDTFKYTLDAVKDRVTQLARQGEKIPGKKLVRGIARAKCTDEESLVSEAIDAGADESELYTRKLKGKTAIKKIVGKEIADKYFVTPDAGLTLVPRWDKRTAVMADQRPDAKGIFTGVKR